MHHVVEHVEGPLLQLLESTTVPLMKNCILEVLVCAQSLNKQRLLHHVVKGWVPVSYRCLKLVDILSEVGSLHVDIALQHVQPGLNVPLCRQELVLQPPHELLPRLGLIPLVLRVLVSEVFAKLQACMLNGCRITGAS